MKRTAYNKLVRDNIPQLIDAQGLQATVRQVHGQDKLQLLHKKLAEEMEEYLQSNALEELADLLEVVHGILDCTGQTWADLESARIAKRQERGAFEKGLLLVEVIKP